MISIKQRLDENDLIAKQIQKLRSAQGHSLREFGYLLGVDCARVWRLEHGQRIPPPNLCDRLRALDPSFDWHRHCARASGWEV